MICKVELFGNYLKNHGTEMIIPYWGDPLSVVEI